MNNFEKAIRTKLRFQTVKGEITTEQMLVMPLQSAKGFDLDSLAKQVNRELKALTEESFVTVSTNPAKASLELQLELIKTVIAERIEAADKRKKEADVAAERQRLMDILHQKKDQELTQLSPEEIQQRIDDLGK